MMPKNESPDNTQNKLQIQEEEEEAGGASRRQQNSRRVVMHTAEQQNSSTTTRLTPAVRHAAAPANVLFIPGHHSLPPYLLPLLPYSAAALMRPHVLPHPLPPPTHTPTTPPQQPV